MKKVKPELMNSVVSKFGNEFFWHLHIHDDRSELNCTESVQSVTGFSVEQFNSIKDRTNELIYKDDMPDYKKQMDIIRNDPDKNEMIIEYRLKRKDGRLIWVHETMKVIRDEDGNLIEFFGNVRDITNDREEVNNLKKRVQELEEINSAKDNFISVLSHDLRAPFTSILGFSEILLNETSLSDKEKAEYLAYINDSSQNQLQLINYLLDWSRLQTNRMKIEPMRLNAQSIVFNCVSALTGSAVRKNINIKVNVPDNLFIEADERLINIVITNLLSNAIKFSSEGNVVEVNADYFSNKFIEFIFIDEGTGIPEANVEKIFHISKIFTTPGTKGEKGTGLGLALAKQIIQKHEGEIWFYSNEGVGSEFHFTIPLSANSILIVKEDEQDRLKLGRKLTEFYNDVQIISASNGFEALQFIEKNSPTLILIDHDLPLMNGLKLAESIKKMNKISPIPVVAFIDEGEYETRKNYQELGILTFDSEKEDELKLRENIKSYLF